MEITENFKKYLSGFFDGDGSINIASARPHLRRVEICGSSKQFLLQIKSILEKNAFLLSFLAHTR